MNNDEIVQILNNVCQLIDGWHGDGTAWTEFDEETRKGASKLLQHFMAEQPPVCICPNPSVARLANCPVHFKGSKWDKDQKPVSSPGLRQAAEAVCRIIDNRGTIGSNEDAFYILQDALQHEPAPASASVRDALRKIVKDPYLTIVEAVQIAESALAAAPASNEPKQDVNQQPPQAFENWKRKNFPIGCGTRTDAMVRRLLESCWNAAVATVQPLPKPLHCS